MEPAVELAGGRGARGRRESSRCCLAQQCSAGVADALLHLLRVVLACRLAALCLRLRRVARPFTLYAALLPCLLQPIRLRLLRLSHGSVPPSREMGCL